MASNIIATIDQGDRWQNGRKYLDMAEYYTSVLPVEIEPKKEAV